MNNNQVEIWQNIEDKNDLLLYIAQNEDDKTTYYVQGTRSDLEYYEIILKIYSILKSRKKITYKTNYNKILKEKYGICEYYLKYSGRGIREDDNEEIQKFKKINIEDVLLLIDQEREKLSNHIALNISEQFPNYSKNWYYDYNGDLTDEIEPKYNRLIYTLDFNPENIKVSVLAHKIKYVINPLRRIKINVDNVCACVV